MRIAANIALIASPSASSKLRGAASLSSGIATCVLSIRERYGTDGADQVTIITQLTNGVGRLSGDNAVQVAALWNISIQSTLSYAIAGWAKIAGGPWRDGTAVQNVLRTRTYGHQQLWEFFDGHPKLSRMATWGVVAWESLFPVVYVLPVPLAKALIASASVFHAINGQAMGLWRFAFAFASMHPALVATIANRQGEEKLRNPLLAPTLVILTGLGVSSVAASILRRRRIIAMQQTLHRVESSTGNTLFAEIHPGDRESTVIFEAGLLALPEHFAWLRKGLEEEGYTTVTYYRAGYGPSLRVSTGEQFHLNQSVDDLASVIGAFTKSDETISLVGHSLGAEICRRYVARAPKNKVSSIVYVDPAHPDEFNRSELQTESAITFNELVGVYRFGVAASLGSLLSVPPWVKALPRAVQSSALDQYRDSRLWNAGTREWKAVSREWEGGFTIDAKLDCNALVVSSGRTVNADPVIGKLHAELAQAHRDAGRRGMEVTIDDTSHDSILTNQAHASECYQEIIRFLASNESNAR